MKMIFESKFENLFNSMMDNLIGEAATAHGGLAPKAAEEIVNYWKLGYTFVKDPSPRTKWIVNMKSEPLKSDSDWIRTNADSILKDTYEYDFGVLYCKPETDSDTGNPSSIGSAVVNWVLRRKFYFDKYRSKRKLVKTAAQTNTNFRLFETYGLMFDIMDSESSNSTIYVPKPNKYFYYRIDLAKLDLLLNNALRTIESVDAKTRKDIINKIDSLPISTTFVGGQTLIYRYDNIAFAEQSTRGLLPAGQYFTLVDKELCLTEEECAFVKNYVLRGEFEMNDFVYSRIKHHSNGNETTNGHKYANITGYDNIHDLIMHELHVPDKEFAVGIKDGPGIGADIIESEDKFTISELIERVPDTNHEVWAGRPLTRNCIYRSKYGPYMWVYVWNDAKGVAVARQLINDKTQLN